MLLSFLIILILPHFQRNC